MARTALTVNNITLAGFTLTIANGTTGAADGQSFVNTGNELITVYNGNVGALPLTVVSGKATDRGADYTAETISIPAASFKVVGPFESAPFNQTGNLVHLDFDAGNEADFNVTAFKFTST